MTNTLLQKTSFAFATTLVLISTFLLSAPLAHAAVTNLVGVQVGAGTRPGWQGCGLSYAGMDGAINYAPNITGGWSGVAIKQACLDGGFFTTINWGQQDYFDWIRIYISSQALAAQKIPVQTDIRVCSQEKNGSNYGVESCTPWASELADSTWGDSGMPGGDIDIDGVRFKVETRPMLGRSITDMKLRLRGTGADWLGTYTSGWKETPWRSAGGDWSPTVGGISLIDSIEVGLMVKSVSLSVAVLTPQNFTKTGTLTVGQTLSFSGEVQNTGTAVSSLGTARLCIDNASCATTATGAFASPAIPVLAVGETSTPLGGSWVATLGSHTPYFCVVGGTCVSLPSFTVAVAPPLDCSLDGASVSNGSSRNFYNTPIVPFGQSCDTGSSSGVPYAQSRMCTNGVLSGSASYNKATCVTGAAPVQSNITFSANNTLVRTGSSVLLTWNGGNSTSCSLQGTNGFTSSAINGTGVSSGAINQRSIFTLVCSLGSSTKTAAVNVSLIPKEIEI